MPEQDESFAEQAGQRAQSYWLLSKLFLDLPGGASLAELDAALAEWEQGESPLQPAIGKLRLALADGRTDPQAIAVEMTRHLVAVNRESGASLPFESHFRERRLPGAATEQLQGLLIEAGYDEVAPQAGPPDHLGAQLRFMALLCYDEREAWLANDAQAAVASLRRQRHLLQAHLDAWVPAYCAGLIERTPNTYLQGIAGLTIDAINADREVLESIAGQVDSLFNTIRS